MSTPSSGRGLPVSIRPATLQDAAEIARIYNMYVLGSTATFDIEPHTVERREEWLRGRSAEYPVLIAENGSSVLGWAALSPYRERPAWRHTVEVAVYVGEDARGQGIGPQLLDAVLDSARDVGHHAAVAQVTTENVASLKTLERAGFERVGTLIQVGRKFDRWLDVAILQHTLDR